MTIDIIILSYAKTDELKSLTEQTISTLLASENETEIKFNVLVIESNKSLAPFQFKGSKTIYPNEAFGFNKYLNIGIRETENEYVCLCNNDLVFRKNWARAILKVFNANNQIGSVCSACPDTHPKSGFELNSAPLEGYENLFSGWCFTIKRSILETIGLFDEKFNFWYADSDYLNTLKVNNIKNFLAPSSHVIHLKGETTKHLSPKQLFKLTQLPRLYFNYKWRKEYKIIYWLKVLHAFVKRNF